MARLGVVVVMAVAPAGAVAQEPIEKPRAASKQEIAGRYRAGQQALNELFTAGKYAEAAAKCRELIELVPGEPQGHYNLACALARLGDRKEALASLTRAVDLGWTAPDHLAKDPDLTALRDDARFVDLVAQSRENEREKFLGRPIEGVKTRMGNPEGGLRWRLRMSPTATADQPNRLVVWLHPAGTSANDQAESLTPLFLKHGYALLVFTEKDFRYWSATDARRLSISLNDLKGIDGIRPWSPIFLGFSAGGQMALLLWAENPDQCGGLVLDAAYPVQRTATGYEPLPLPKDEAYKKVPILALVGDADQGKSSWLSVAPRWRAAGVPLTVLGVPGQGHTWLFGPDQRAELDRWLGQVADGQLPSRPTPAPEQANPPAD